MKSIKHSGVALLTLIAMAATALQGCAGAGIGYSTSNYNNKQFTGYVGKFPLKLIHKDDNISAAVNFNIGLYNNALTQEHITAYDIGAEYHQFLFGPVGLFGGIGYGFSSYTQPGLTNSGGGGAGFNYKAGVDITEYLSLGYKVTPLGGGDMNEMYVMLQFPMTEADQRASEEYAKQRAATMNRTDHYNGEDASYCTSRSGSIINNSCKQPIVVRVSGNKYCTGGNVSISGNSYSMIPCTDAAYMSIEGATFVKY